MAGQAGGTDWIAIICRCIFQAPYAHEKRHPATESDRSTKSDEIDRIAPRRSALGGSAVVVVVQQEGAAHDDDVVVIVHSAAAAGADRSAADCDLRSTV